VAHRVIPCDLGLLVKRRDRLTRIVLATDDDDPALTWLVPHLRRALDEVDRCREALRTPDLGV
jgi:hypothetical protein